MMMYYDRFVKAFYPPLSMITQSGGATNDDDAGPRLQVWISRSFSQNKNQRKKILSAVHQVRSLCIDQHTRLVSLHR
jgi:hypothetical protein